MKAFQEERQEVIWFLEHPHLFSIGKSGAAHHIFDQSVPVYESSRGGKVVYHGPGQLVVYCVLDLTKRNKGINEFVYGLEEVMLRVLDTFGLQGFRKTSERGVWVDQGKIGFIGCRISKGMTMHGLAFNYAPELSYFDKIVPCGNPQKITSLKDIGINTTRAHVESSFINHVLTIY